MFAPLSWQNKYRLEKILITSLNVRCKFICICIVIHENDIHIWLVISKMSIPAKLYLS